MPKLKMVVRAVYKPNGDFVRWVDVGLAYDIEDAKRRFTPLQYDYAVIMKE